MLGAAFNAATYFAGARSWPLLSLRFVTGFFLAGIYPVGMKIASGWFDRELGKALGFLVGALVLGTAAPHMIRAFGRIMPWEAVMLSVSAIAAAGGLVMYAFVPDGPDLKPGASFDPTAFADIFRSPDFRASSFAYFGHMWELYALWAFIPQYLAAFGPGIATDTLGISFWSSIAIGSGAIGCIMGGLASLRLGALVASRSRNWQPPAPVACCHLSHSGCLIRSSWHSLYSGAWS